MSETSFMLKLGDWTVRERGGRHLLRATLGGDLIFEASLRPAKPAALNGHEGLGVSFKDSGEASRYFSYTRMSAEGRRLFELRDTPQLLATDPRSGALYFVHPASEVPSVWAVAQLRAR